MREKRSELKNRVHAALSGAHRIVATIRLAWATCLNSVRYIPLVIRWRDQVQVPEKQLESEPCQLPRFRLPPVIGMEIDVPTSVALV